MSDVSSGPEDALGRWLTDQHRVLVNDLAATLDLTAGLLEAMIPARHAGLVTGLRDVLDIEAGLNEIMSTASDMASEISPDPWQIDESTSSPGTVSVAVRRGAAAKVFVSYAHEDRALAGELCRRLVEDGHEVLLDQDLRDGIAVGEAWEQRLHERLRWADAMVCVVTSAYLASRWCTAEVGFARSQGRWLLPVRAEPGLDDPLLRPVEDANLRGDSVGAALVKTLRRVDGTGVLTWPEDRSPFPGLRPFDTDQHRVFFGRTDETKQLAGLLKDLAERAESAALLVTGSSGCGKSSLVRAGLLPVMANEPGWWTLPPIVPGADPVAALTRGLTITAQQNGLDWTVEDVRRQLDERGLGELADKLLLATPGGQRHLLVVVDQFEELLTQAAPTERGRFTELLRSALTGRVQIVGTLRPEFLDPMLLESELNKLSTTIYSLRPLRGEALHTIIEGPARLAGIGVEEHLVARLIHDAGGEEALPLLAYTLAQLADGVSRGGQLSNAYYDEFGGLQGSLTRQADAALDAAVWVSGLTEREVLAELTRLVTVDNTGRPARRRIKLADLGTPQRVALDVFVDYRLLHSSIDDGQVWLNVTHEALLTNWPPLDYVIADITNALRAAQAVEQAAADWNNAGRSEHYLWNNERLTSTLTTLGMAGDTGDDRSPATHAVVELHDEILAFIDATSMHVQTTRRQETRRRTRTITVLTGLLIFALVAACVAVWQQQLASRAQHIAIAHQLVAHAEATQNSDPRISLQLGLAAQRIYSDSETYSSLVNLVTNTRYAGSLIGHTGAVLSVAFSPDGHTWATASADATVELWDVSDPARPTRLSILIGHTGRVLSVAFSPDGHILATASSDETVRLWDISNPRKPGDPTILYGDVGRVLSVAFSPVGRTLTTADDDGTVRLWDISTRHPTDLSISLVGHNESLTWAAFSPDDRTLATASDDQTVKLWDVGLWDVSSSDPGWGTAAERVYPTLLGENLASHTSTVNSIAFSADGRTLATASDDQSVRLWDVSSPARPRLLGEPLTGHTSALNSVAFSPDGRTLATAGSDNTVRLWDITNPTRPQSLQSIIGYSQMVRSVVFAPNGRTLATASDDGTTELWDLSGSNDYKDIIKRACTITKGGLSPNQWAQYIPGLPYQDTCPN